MWGLIPEPLSKYKWTFERIKKSLICEDLALLCWAPSPPRVSSTLIVFSLALVILTTLYCGFVLIWFSCLFKAFMIRYSLIFSFFFSHLIFIYVLLSLFLGSGKLKVWLCLRLLMRATVSVETWLHYFLGLSFSVGKKGKMLIFTGLFCFFVFYFYLILRTKSPEVPRIGKLVLIYRF